MGGIIEFNCYKCGHVWEIFHGYPLFSNAMSLFCNKCGKSIMIEKDPDSYKCECGGTFEVSPEHYYCPECGSADNDGGKCVGMWD